jgi:ArsR family transcriptional regulator
MSQHLSRLREEGLVATRRTGTRIRYRVADPRVSTVIAFFKTLSGAPAGQPAAAQAAA